LLLHLLRRYHGSFNRISLDRTEHFARHRLVNPQTAELNGLGMRNLGHFR
jgi:hypothetical protein